MGSLLDVPGLRLGHWTADRTGCTVVLAPPDGAMAAIDVRGGAPASFNTELLHPLNLVERVHALVLTGGSAFGLATASGVTRWLRERGVGLRYGGVDVPIVCGAAIFDLGVAQTQPPDTAAGFAACEAATPQEHRRGLIGAGAGATAGKALGLEGATPGGLGMASLRCGQNVVGALVVVNPVGDVVDRGGQIVTGARHPDGSFLNTVAFLEREGSLHRAPPSNTTLAVVATDAPLTREGALKMAQMAHDGLARAIRPAHTMSDGDIVFALATGSGPASDVSAIGALAAEALQDAILDAVRSSA